MPLNAPPAPSPAERNVYTVSRLNREVRLLLEHGLPVVWLEGELSNFSAPSSGHWYFSLKDREAQIRCAMFRQKNIGVGFTPKSGQLVLAAASPASFQQIAAAQILPATVRAYPALADGILYVRNDNTLIAVDLR